MASYIIGGVIILWFVGNDGAGHGCADGGCVGINDSTYACCLLLIYEVECCVQLLVFCGGDPVVHLLLWDFLAHAQFSHIITK